MDASRFSAIVDFWSPVIFWAGIAALVVWWLLRRCEARLAASQAHSLRFPMSPMVFLSRRIVIEGLVQDREVRAAIEERAAETGVSVAELEKRVRRQANEMVPAFKAVFYFWIGYWLARTLLLTMYRVRMVRDSREEYARIGRDATVVLFMNHRSNIDVLLVNYLLAPHSALAHAAGEWARLWPLHHLVRFAGNYVVDRDSNDPLYRLLLKRYVQMAVTHGIHLAIFPEGSLSRDGRLRPMSFGLLNYAASASWPGFERDVVFIPVAFNYDRIPEQRQLVLNEKRGFGDRGPLYVALGSLKFAARFLRLPFTKREDRFGWACASFGEPISLKAWQRARGIELRTMPTASRREHIDALGRQLIRDVSGLVPVLPVHIVATALLDETAATRSVDWLEERAQQLRLALDAAGVPLFDYDMPSPGNFHEGLRVLEQTGAVAVSADRTVTIVEGQEVFVRFYANSIAHYLKPGREATEPDVPVTEARLSDAGKTNFLSIIFESYDRAVNGHGHGHGDEDGFFQRFYDVFLKSSPEVAAKFANTDMAQQREHLRRSLKHMVDYAVSGKPNMRMRQIARSHGRARRDIAAPLYDYWLQSLLATLKERDASFDSSTELAWRSLMAPGIAYLRAEYAADSHEMAASEHETSPSSEGIARWIDHWAGRAASRMAIASPERSLTYGELADEVGRLAAGLRSRLRVDSGDRVAYLGTNRVEFIVLLFACARLGAVLVPINFRLSVTERALLMERTRPKALFVGTEFLDDAVGGPGSWQLVAMGAVAAGASLRYEDILNVPGPMKANAGTLASPLLIVFTSGSTGDPKGAVLSQGAIHWNALNSRLMHDLTRSDHVVTTLPFFHVGGINIQTLPALQVGAKVTLLPRFDAGSFAEFVETERPTLTVLVPAQMQQLMELEGWLSADFSSLRAVSTGSTIVGQELIARWADKGIPVIQVYGCTESGPIAAHQTVEGIEAGWGTVGHPALYTEIMIADVHGRPVPTGAEGEILLRGPSLASEYWQDEAATRAAFRNGWLATGDLGYFDADGRISVVGRIKRLIISGGENIHPAEIEHALESLDAVREAAVIGVGDEKWGEVPVAVVVPAEGETVSEPDIRRHLDTHLGRYKHPRSILISSSLPRTGLDKVAYQELAAWVAERLEAQSERDGEV